MNPSPKFFLAIPAYRESERLPRYLEELASAVEKLAPEARIQIVDDGSGEFEQEKLRGKIEQIRSRHGAILEPLWLPDNRGKGGAILEAWDRAGNFPYVAFVDADGAISAEEVCRVARLLNADDRSPALFASRVKMLGRTVERTTFRHITGRFFAFLVASSIDESIYDSQCGLKFVPQSTCRQIRPWLKGRRFAFDVELFAALKTIGCPVVEVPIDWIDVPGSKVSFFRDTIRMVNSLILIKKEMVLWMSPKKTN